jgi:hypothetical protein
VAGYLKARTQVSFYKELVRLLWLVHKRLADGTCSFHKEPRWLLWVPTGGLPLAGLRPW